MPVMEPRGPKQPRKRSIAGLRILITRPPEHAAGWIEKFRSVGATPVLYPTIAVTEPESWAPLDAALSQIQRYRWIIFTSRVAAQHTLARRPPGVRLCGEGRSIAVVGPATRQALESAGECVRLEPREKRSVALIEPLLAQGLTAKTEILFPQAVGGRPELVSALAAANLRVHVVPASQTVPIRPLPALPRFDAAVFASPSAFQSFRQVHGISSLSSALVVALGKTTAQAICSAGLRVNSARTPDFSSLAAALAEGVT